MLATLRQLLGVMDRPRRWQFALLLTLMLAGAVAEFATIGALIPFLTLLAGSRRALPFGLTPVSATVIFVVVIAAAGALRLALAWASQRFVAQSAHDATVDIQRRLLHQPYPFHLARNSSASIAALEQTQFAYSIVQQLLQGVAASLLSMGIAAILLVVEPRLTLLVGALIATLYAIVWRLSAGSLARNSTALGGAYAERVRIVQEASAGVRDVIIDQTQGPLIESLRRADRGLMLARVRTSLIAATPRVVVETIGVIVLAGTALVLARQHGGLAAAIPALGALALGAQRMLPLVQQIFQASATLAGNRTVLEEVAALLALPVPPAQAQSSPLGLQRDIRLDGVSFRYPGRAEPALSNIDLTLPRGARVALVGPTGSGKSTLADLIMGLIEPCEGAIEIDGIRLDADNAGAWQQSIAHVPQAIFLADASIAPNIALALGDAPIDPVRVAEAAKIAQLGDFVATLPEGLDTRVGERGMALSGGQRQRIGIARALYKGAPVLILDEATNALDAATEQALLSALAGLGEKTIVFIAHRESTIARCDLLVRLDEGRVVEVRSL